MALENLLVAKINDVRVMQVDESKVSVENKKADSKKPSQTGGNPFETNSGGENKTVDLGAGARNYTAQFYAFNVEEIDRLTDILLKQRFCTITDKFRGKLSVYIDKYETVYSDKYVGKTIFAITATVQDVEKIPTVNAEAQLEGVVEELEDELTTQAESFASSIVNIAEDAEGFVDKALDTVEKGMTKVLDLQVAVMDVFNEVRAKVNRLKRLGETLKLITQLPNDFVDLVQETAETQTSQLIDLFFATTSTGVIVQKLEEFVSEDGVINTTNTELSDLSQIELNELKKTVGANELLNLMTAVAEMKQILTKEYTSQKDFDTQVNLCITRLGVTSLSDQNIITARQSLKAFSNQTNIKGLIDYEVKEEMPLTAIVYGLYGDLNFYTQLRDINNFKDNDAIIGTIQIYDV